MMKDYKPELKKWLEKPETTFYKRGNGSTPMIIKPEVKVLWCNKQIQEEGKEYMNGWNSKFTATIEVYEKTNETDSLSVRGNIEVYANVENNKIVAIDGEHISFNKD